MNPLFIAGAQATKHAIMRTLSVICVLLVCAGIWFAIDRAFIHPPKTESYAQKADTISNVEYHYDYSDKDLLFLGVKLWRIRLGVTVK